MLLFLSLIVALHLTNYPTLCQDLRDDVTDDVNVGEISLGTNRLIYTYLNSSNVVQVLAIGAFIVIGFAIFLYVYDVYLSNGNNERYDHMQGANFDYYDPYGYASYHSTSRIRR